MIPSANADADAVPLRPQRLLWEFAPILVGALPFLVLTIVSLLQSHQPGSVSSDLAISELRTRAAVHFAELLGPYSRFGWSHPGPISYYWMAPFYLISGDRTGGLAAASAAANLGWVVAIIAAARAAAGRTTAWMAAAVLLGFAAIVGTPWLRDPWNPFQVILPVAAVAVLGAAVLAGVRWALPGAALAATWALQTHIGTTPVVGITVMVTIGPAIWAHRGHLRPWRSAVRLAVGGTLVLWGPPLIEQFRHPPGNLRLLYRFLSTTPTTLHPLNDVLRLVAPQLTLSSHRLGEHVYSGPRRFSPLGPGEISVVVVLFAIVVFGAWQSRRTGARFQLGCCLAALGGGIVAVIATATAKGQLFSYITTFSTGIGIIVWLAVLLTVTATSQRLRHPSARSASFTRPPPLFLKPYAAALLVGFALLLSTYAIRVPGFAASANDPAVTKLAIASRLSLGPDRHRPVLIVIGENTPWQHATGLAAMLERDGYTLRTTQNWVFMFGYRYRPHGDERDGLLVLGSFEGTFPKPPADAVFVAQTKTVQVWNLPAIEAAKATYNR